jgi:RNA polymerase sigma factor (sigma-70 family)
MRTPSSAMGGRAEVTVTSDKGFTEFYIEHLPRLRRFLARRINSKETREDLETTIMTAAWRRFSANTQAERSFGWLAGIAGGIVANERRSERRRRALVDRVIANNSFAPQAGLSRTYDSVDGLEPRVAYALGRLSDDDREVLLLHEWDECTYEEIAAAFGSSEVTARKRVSRARQRFATHYKAFLSMSGDCNVG